ncbi:MAG TPA: flavin reductase family protein [Vampirovibrionales bacterium]
MKNIFKLQDYEVYSVTTIEGGLLNANIATWVMQSAMKGKRVIVALDKDDLTIRMVKSSGIFNLNLLSQKQSNLINLLGRKSGKDIDKFKKLNYFLDSRGCPYLLEAVGYIQAKVLNSMDSLDHEVFVCEVLNAKVLNPDEPVLKLNYLRSKKLVRG